MQRNQDTDDGGMYYYSPLMDMVRISSQYIQMVDILILSVARAGLNPTATPWRLSNQEWCYLYENDERNNKEEEYRVEEKCRLSTKIKGKEIRNDSDDKDELETKLKITNLEEEVASDIAIVKRKKMFKSKKKIYMAELEFCY